MGDRRALPRAGDVAAPTTSARHCSWSARRTFPKRRQRRAGGSQLVRRRTRTGGELGYGSATAGCTAFRSGLRDRLAASGVPVVTVSPGYAYSSAPACPGHPRRRLLPRRLHHARGRHRRSREPSPARDSRPHSPDSGASNTAAPAASNPFRSGDVAARPRANASPFSVGTVMAFSIFQRARPPRTSCAMLSLAGTRPVTQAF